MDDLGPIAEMKVLADLTEAGWNVFLAVSRSAPFDLFAHKGWRSYRIQVKGCAKPTDGRSYKFKLSTSYLRSSGRQEKDFDRNSCDILALYMLEDDTTHYCWTVDLPNRKSISIKAEKAVGIDDLEECPSGKGPGC